MEGTDQERTDRTRPDVGGARGIDRRQALKAALGGTAAAAALAAPSIRSYRIAPPYAAAATVDCLPPPSFGFNTWTASTNPSPGSWQTDSGMLGFYTAPGDVYSGMGPVHLVEADPPAGTYPRSEGGTPTGVATYTSPQFQLGEGATYGFNAPVRWRHTTNHTARQLVEFQYRIGNGPWVTVTSFQTTASTGVHNTSLSFQITPDATAIYQIRFRHSFSGPIGTPNSQRANDIAVAAPTYNMVPC